MSAYASVNQHGFCTKSAFIRLSEKTREYCASVGVNVVPFKNLQLPFFSTLSRERQLQVLANLESNIRVCEITLSNGEKLTDSAAMTWSAIKELKLRPTSDLFSFITNDAVIEIHDAQGCQLYRNFQFYSFCSYTLEELYCLPWNELYTRDESVLNGLFALASKIYAGQVKETISTGLPTHVIKELNSPFKYEINADVDYLSPLYDLNNRPVATVAIERGQLTGRSLTGAEEEYLLSEHSLKMQSPNLT